MGVESVELIERRGLFAGGGDQPPVGPPSAGGASDPQSDFERDLGVIEAITIVTRSCPSGAVVAVAERALEAIKKGGAEVMREQAYYVLTALQGWRGDRARQVHRSLSLYLEPPGEDREDEAPDSP